MKFSKVLSLAPCGLLTFLIAFSTWAADYPTPKESNWVLRDFRFNTGEVLPELKLSYFTIGDPSGEPVLILHGTGAAATNYLNNDFAGELFGPGQPLDAKRYFIIIPDAIGAGKSSKPSDGLRTKLSPLHLRRPGPGTAPLGHGASRCAAAAIGDGDIWRRDAHCGSGARCFPISWTRSYPCRACRSSCLAVTG
jgi:hypothetical protein